VLKGFTACGLTRERELQVIKADLKIQVWNKNQLIRGLCKMIIIKKKNKNTLSSEFVGFFPTRFLEAHKYYTFSNSS